MDDSIAAAQWVTGQQNMHSGVHRIDMPFASHNGMTFQMYLLQLHKAANPVFSTMCSLCHSCGECSE